jgi:hypothetical protein
VHGLRETQVFDPRGNEPRSMVWRYMEGARRKVFAGEGRAGDDAEEVDTKGATYAEEGVAIPRDGGWMKRNQE